MSRGRGRGRVATDEEIREASSEGFWGAVHGAAIWGVYGIIAGVGAYSFSPVYRRLTPQFKVFLQMSFMTTGAVLHSERRRVEYEKQARVMRKMKRDAEAWRLYEEDYESGRLGKASEQEGVNNRKQQ